MRYIVTKQFDKDGIWGHFNIAKGELAYSTNGMIHYGGHQVCVDRSQNAHEHFTLDEDSHGLERRALIDATLGAIASMREEYSSAVAAIMEDMEVPPEEREAAASQVVDKAAAAFDDIHADPELDALMTNGIWNHAFYEASIETLTKLKGVVESHL